MFSLQSWLKASINMRCVSLSARERVTVRERQSRGQRGLTLQLRAGVVSCLVWPPRAQGYADRIDYGIAGGLR